MPILTVERFAEIRALLDAGQVRAGVLGAHGLDEAGWREEEERVLSDLADAAEQGDTEKLRAYELAHQATSRKVVGGARALQAKSELVASEARDVGAVSAAPGFAAGTAEASGGARTGAPRVGGRRAPTELSGTSLGSVAPKGSPLPFGAAPATPAVGDGEHTAALRIRERRAPTELSGTSVGSAPMGPPLPFAAPAPAVADPPRAPAVQIPSGLRTRTRASSPWSADVRGTLDGVADSEPALPFDPSAAPTLASPQPARGSRSRSPLGGTMDATEAPTRQALPFPPAAAPPPGSEARSPTEVSGTVDGFAYEQPSLPFNPNAARNLPPPEPLSARRGPSPLGATADATSAPAGEALPFTSGGAAPPSGVSLEQYASLCVELAADPKTEEVLRRYALTADERKALDTHWQGRFKADPSVWMDYDRAYKAYKKWFAASRG